MADWTTVRFRQGGPDDKLHTFCKGKFLRSFLLKIYMDEAEDGDLSLQRASLGAIESLKKRLKHCLGASTTSKSVQQARDDAASICKMLDMFQEDPQLLDSHLKDIVYPVLSRFLVLIQQPQFHTDDTIIRPQVKFFSQIICMLCKVRGKKVISRFMENEPRHVIVIIHALQAVTANSASLEPGPLLTHAQSTSNVDEHFVLLLWLSHLILTPFDLESLSSGENEHGNVDGFDLSPSLPSIAASALHAGISSLGTATNRQAIAAMLLTRLCLRPDMSQFTLLSSMINWALEGLAKILDASAIHKAIGLLCFLSNTIASADMIDIGPHLQRIRSSVTAVFDDESGRLSSIQGSAAAKRQSIKIQRNIIVHLLRARGNLNSAVSKIVETMLDTNCVLEDVIDYLLRLLADRDTQVRMAASKALSVITLNLDREMAEEVVEAILASLREDVSDARIGVDVANVNPVRWHGLVLTLSHMLFRRTPSPRQIPDVLNALCHGLRFEQKSTSGSSIGTNVRDAANFGYWSLARRYSTAELLTATSLNLRDTSIQLLANNLLCAACLDPIGNVRRGASAALQELVGRHPDTVVEGIGMIQIIDYHAVGKRTRALGSLVIDASRLNPALREMFLLNIYDWRGVSAPDRLSREVAATTVGKLIRLMSIVQSKSQVQTTLMKAHDDPSTNAEFRQGLMFCLASTLSSVADSSTTLVSCHQITNFRSAWEMFAWYLNPYQKELATSSKQARILASGVLALTEGIARMVLAIAHRTKALIHDQPSAPVLQLVAHCLCKVDHLYPDTFLFGEVLDSGNLTTFLGKLLNEIERAYKPSAIPAVIRALSKMYPLLHDSGQSPDSEHWEDRGGQQKILQSLLQISLPPQDIESRVIGVKALGHLMSRIRDTATHHYSLYLDEDAVCRILDALLVAMNDYTTNERGDLGSLVRLEALKSFEDFIMMTETAGLDNMGDASAIAFECQRCVIRLSLERLDKVRAQATSTLSHLVRLGRASWSGPGESSNLGNIGALDISSYDHFYSVARLLSSVDTSASVTGDARDLCSAIILGIATSAGAGSSALQTVARAALGDVLEPLHVYPPQKRMTGMDQPTNVSLFDVGEMLQDLLAANLTNDRVMIPLLETVAFLLDANILQRLSSGGDAELHPPQPRYKWLTFLSLVQKAHYKTASIPKLLAAVAVYRGFGDISEIRAQVLSKMTAMLMHPFPTVRVAVAETLFVITQEEALTLRVWTDNEHRNREFVEEIKTGLVP